jgi:hypothetical protein
MPNYICLPWEGLFIYLFLHVGYASFGLSLDFPFCLPWNGFDHRFFIGFWVFLNINIRSLSLLRNRFKNSHPPTPRHLCMFKFLIIRFAFHLVMGKTDVWKHSQNVRLDLTITLSWALHFLEFPHQRTLSYTKFLTCDIIFKAYMRCWNTILFPKMHNINWKSGIQYNAKTLWKVHYVRVVSLIFMFFFPFKFSPTGDKNLIFQFLVQIQLILLKFWKKIIKITNLKIDPYLLLESL